MYVAPILFLLAHVGLDNALGDNCMRIRASLSKSHKPRANVIYTSTGKATYALV